MHPLLQQHYVLFLRVLTGSATLKYKIQYWKPVQALWFKFSAREHNYEEIARWAFEVTGSNKGTHICASVYTHTLTGTHERKENKTVDCSPIKTRLNQRSPVLSISFSAQQPHCEETGRTPMLSVGEKKEDAAERHWGEGVVWRKLEKQGYEWIADDWNWFFYAEKQRRIKKKKRLNADQGEFYCLSSFCIHVKRER